MDRQFHSSDEKSLGESVDPLGVLGMNTGTTSFVDEFGLADKLSLGPLVLPPEHLVVATAAEAKDLCLICLTP